MSSRKEVNRTILSGLGIIISAIIIILFAVLFEPGFDPGVTMLLAILIPMGVIITLIISVIIYRIIKIRKEQKDDVDIIPSESIFVKIKRFFRRRRGISSFESNHSSMPVSDRSFGRFGPGFNSTTEIENQLNISISNQEEDNKVKLEKFIIRQEFYEENCSICKLSLDTKATVVQCPKCNSLFHFEHLDYWLQTANNCPVCNYKF